MAEYWGLPAIARRLGYKSNSAVMRLFQQEGLPMFKRPNPKTGTPGRFDDRQVWYSDDSMIRRWELLMVEKERARIRASGGDPGAPRSTSIWSRWSGKP